MGIHSVVSKEYFEWTEYSILDIIKMIYIIGVNAIQHVIYGFGKAIEPDVVSNFCFDALRDTRTALRPVWGRECSSSGVGALCELLFSVYAGDTGSGGGCGIWEKAYEILISPWEMYQASSSMDVQCGQRVAWMEMVLLQKGHSFSVFSFTSSFVCICRSLLIWRISRKMTRLTTRKLTT